MRSAAASRTFAITRPPAFAASCVEKEPTPPPAPTISTVLPLSGSSNSTNASAEPPDVGSAAASTGSRPSGTRASGASSVTTTSSAYVPADPIGAISSWPKRSSPRENLFVPSPMLSTTPSPSAPSTIGNVAGAGCQSPLASVRSIGFIPAARILIRIWPGPGCGVGTSAKTGAPPYALTTTARIRPFSPIKPMDCNQLPGVCVTAVTRGSSPSCSPQGTRRGSSPVMGQRCWLRRVLSSPRRQRWHPARIPLRFPFRQLRIPCSSRTRSPETSAATRESRKPKLERPCSRAESPPISAQLASAKTGLSRRRSRVRVPSLPFASRSGGYQPRAPRVTSRAMHLVPRIRATVDRAAARVALLGADPNDNEDLRARKALLVLISVLILPVSALWGALYLALGSPVGVVPLVYFGVLLGAIAVFSRTRDFPRLLLVSQIAILLAPTLSMIPLGGFVDSGGVGLWGILAPLGALVF